MPRVFTPKPFAPSGFEVMFFPMDWQQLVSLMLVAAAAALLLAGKLRRRRFQFQRDTHCGCGSVAQSAPQNTIIFRARKGQRPEVLVKMR
ncbi:MAG TPA: hypothetical protein VN578_22660 [Candidatus Binatia bacterium]|nr:hypothetical protein [Candidatus Binatia bacterium]